MAQAAVRAQRTTEQGATEESQAVPGFPPSLPQVSHNPPTPEEVARPPQGHQAVKATPVGVNPDGHPLTEDENGVRSYVENGIQITEPVTLVPGRGGVGYAVDRAANPEFEVAGQPPGVPSEIMEQVPAHHLAALITGTLEADKKISPKDLQKLAEQAYGGTMASGAVPRAEMYDAMEFGVNRYIAAHPERFDPRADLDAAKTAAGELADLKNKLPTQSVRAGEKEALQQFSTPPDYSYAAAWAANLGRSDRVLEPSAGTGSLVAHALNSGAQKVWANDLSDTRAGMLNTMGLAGVTRENAEQIHGVLPADVNPSVVLMNPPFSNSAGRGTVKDVTVGAQHVEDALRRLEPGGRLVAITGDGMRLNAPTFRKWWDKIGRQYDVRANIGVDGSIYRKYGTTFPTRLIVIDKVPPSGRAPVTTEVKDAQGILEALKDVRADRPRVAGEQAAGEPVGAGMARPGQGAGAGPEAAVSGAARPLGARAGAEGAGRESVTAGAGRTGEPVPGAAGAAQPGANPEVAAGQSKRGRNRATLEPTSGATTRADAAPSGDIGAGDGVRPDGSGERIEPGVTPAPETVRVTEAAVTDPSDETLTDAVYEPYKPQRVTVEGAKAHPSALVQSAAMASVMPPKTDYKLSLPKKVITSGALSDAQLEAVIYAGHAHSQMLPAYGDTPERRRGFMDGDATGVGKGRIVSGIIADNWHQGRTKHIWVSEKAVLADDARRDYKGIGQDDKQIFEHGKIKAGDPIRQKQGVLFTTYDTLKSAEQLKQGGEKKRGKTRVDQIVDWVGPDFDGVIAFDEVAQFRKQCRPERRPRREEGRGQGARGTRTAKAPAESACRLRLGHRRD